MQNLSFNKITNYLMFLTLSLFAAACLYIFSMGLISRLQGNDPSPVIPWTTLQVGFILIVIPFIGKRIYAKVVAVPDEVTLPRPAALFVGLLNGLLYGGALLIILTAIIFCTDPIRLLADNTAKYAGLVLAASGIAGIAVAPHQVARKARLWLLLALICQFVTLSTARQLLGLYPFKYDYSVEEVDLKKMPLVEKQIVEWLIPDGAKNIRIHGIRAGFSRSECTVTMEQLKAFAAKHKFELPENPPNEFAFGNNEFLVYVYNQQTNLLLGYFRRDGLPPHLKKPDTKPAPVEKKENFMKIR